MPLILSGIILWMCPANGRRCYIVTLSLIGWAHTKWLIKQIQYLKIQGQGHGQDDHICSLEFNWYICFLFPKKKSKKSENLFGGYHWYKSLWLAQAVAEEPVQKTQSHPWYPGWLNNISTLGIVSSKFSIRRQWKISRQSILWTITYLYPIPIHVL